MKYKVFWKNSDYKVRSELKKNIECDYLIVGGGITGVSLAYFLAEYGAKNITLIERKSIGSGATGKSAGILTIRGELDLTQLIEIYGRKKGIEYWKINREGLKIIRSIIKKEKLQCEFELQDTLIGSIYKEDLDYLVHEFVEEKEIEKNTLLLLDNEVQREIITPIFKYAVKSEGHAISVNPLKHVQELSNAVEKKGVKIYEYTNLISIRDKTAHTYRGDIKFKKIILAMDTYNPTKRIKTNKSTIAITEQLTKAQIKSIGMVRKKVVWDIEDIYHYMKITKDNRIMIGFGDVFVHRKHKKTEPNYFHLVEIKKFLKKLFPKLKIKIEYAWSGTFGKTTDLIPYISTERDKIVIGGAGSQVMCVMSAKYVADKLINKNHSLKRFFE